MSLVDAIAFQLFTRTSSGAIWDKGSDAYAIARGWVQLDPWLLVAGIVAAAVLISVRRFRGVALAL